MQYGEKSFLPWHISCEHFTRAAQFPKLCFKMDLLACPNLDCALFFCLKKYCLQSLDYSENYLPKIALGIPTWVMFCIQSENMYIGLRRFLVLN